MTKKLILIVMALSLILAPNGQVAQAGLWDKSPFQEETSFLSRIKEIFSFPELDKPVIEKRERFPSNPSITDYIKEDIFTLIKNYEVKRTYTVSVTGYSSEVWQTDSTPFTTASNTHVRDGVVAANFLPFGTLIRIPELYGNKIFIVEDRMNKRYWYNVDIWFADTQIARDFGRKTVTIEVL
jgi:3D (Asp-Asp-Asp) domain-containing protein